MVPMVSINTLCLAPAPFDVMVETVARLEVTAMFPEVTEVTAVGVHRALEALSGAGLKLAGVTHRAFGFATAAEAEVQRVRLLKTIDVCHELGSPVICLTTGGRGGLSWKDAAMRFAEAIEPCVRAADAAGIALGIEPTSHLYSDVSIAHRLLDTVVLAKKAQVKVGIDVFACWVDSDLEEAIVAAGPVCAFVQLSDYVLGDRGLPCRAIPGDGALPLDLIVGQILATGFRGPFDIEVIGPRLFDVDRNVALRRGISRVMSAIETGMAYVKV